MFGFFSYDFTTQIIAKKKENGLSLFFSQRYHKMSYDIVKKVHRLLSFPHGMLNF